MPWLVYRASFVVDAVCRVYIGITEQRSGCSQDMALKRRREYHLDPPVGYPQAAWLQGLDRNSLTLRTVAGQHGLSLKEALLQEAIVAASLFQIDGHGADIVRGGPWLRRRLPSADLAEIKAVSEAPDKEAVKRVADSRPTGSLFFHLHQMPWRGRATQQNPASLFASPPEFFMRRARQSGRHRPCIKRPSGASGAPGKSGQHRPGATRQSGRSFTSGSQSSGAHRRFNKLRMAMKQRR